MSAILSGVAGGLLAAMLAVVAQRKLRPPRLEQDGWQTLRPSWFIHLTLISCSVLLGLFLFALSSFDMTRPDAQEQRLWLLLLISGTAAAVVLAVRTAYSRNISWRGTSVRIRRWFGDEIVRDFSDIASVFRSETSGMYVLQFLDGSRVRFPIYMHGATELVEQLATRACLKKDATRHG